MTASEELQRVLRDRYTLERELGRGGMATVFLAHDLRHDRPVALKMLHPELARALGPERFLREIRTTARLDHPHVLAVFDSGEAQGLLWYTMPYVEGESLRDRVRREGQLALADALRIAGEVAEGLDYAHRHGIVHRDIKPENILLGEGHARVADFGVARAVEAGGGDKLTETGLAVGTPAYMSPEQATAGQVDARSDVYALGCVVYEMLAGEPPYTGPTPQVIIAKRLSEPVPHVGTVRAVPPAVEAAVTRALAKAPADRFTTAGEFATALGAGATLPSVPRERQGTRPLAGALTAALALLIAAGIALGGVRLARRSAAGSVAPAAEEIAVLPFSTSGAGVEHLQEGMVDLLSANLDGVGGIRTVDPRSAVQRWDKARGVGLERARTVGRELRAGSVITGSAVAAGGRVRLSADLHGVNGERLGHAQIEGPADSILRLVDRLSLALLREVWRGREPLPSLDVGALTTESPEALRAYLEGERHFRRNQLDSALADYNRAIEIDSTFASAHFARGEVYGWKERYGAETEQRAYALGFRYAGRLPPRLRLLLSARQLFQAGRPEAVDSARKYVRTYPRSLEGWYLLGDALYHTREHTAVPPDTIVAAFDSVLTLDSARVPATFHPITLTLLYRDSLGYRRYLRVLQATAPAPVVSVGVAAREVTWGSPGDSTIRALEVAGWQPTWAVLLSFYRRPDATSDTVAQAFSRVAALAPRRSDWQRQAVLGRALALAGLGRLAEARQMADTVARVAPSDLGQALGRPIVAGIAPPGFGGSRIDSLLRHVPDFPEKPFFLTVWDLGRGRTADGRRRAEAALAIQDTVRVPPRVRGMLTTALGWADLQAGDSSRGIERLRQGLAATPAPLPGPMDAVRFQFALALSARPNTREEGVRWLRYGFDDNPIYLPLTYLALGRAYEAAGEPDSAALAYGRFVRLWDRADPTLQGRVREAREALQRLTAEPRPR